MGNCSSKTVQLELDSDRSYDLIRAARQKYLEDSEIDSDEHIEPDTPVKPKQQFEQASITKKATTLDPRDYDYPFENLVLEGGGNKGIAYCGAIKVSAALLFYRPCSGQGEPLTLHHLSWHLVPFFEIRVYLDILTLMYLANRKGISQLIPRIDRHVFLLNMFLLPRT